MKRGEKSLIKFESPKEIIKLSLCRVKDGFNPKDYGSDLLMVLTTSQRGKQRPQLSPAFLRSQVVNKGRAEDGKFPLQLLWVFSKVELWDEGGSEPATQGLLS